MRRSLVALAVALSSGLCFTTPLHAAEAAPADAADRRAAATSGLGIAIEPGPGLSAAVIPEGFRSPAPETPCYILISAGRTEVQAPEHLEPLLKTAEALGLRVVIRLTGEGWETGTPGAPFPTDEWVGRTAEFAARLGERVDAYQILDASALGWDPGLFAYFLKRAAVALRGGRPGARIVSPPLAASNAEWVERLFSGDVAPYLDVFAVNDGAALDAVAALRDRLDARSALWLVDAAFDAASPGPSIAHTYFDALARDAEVVLFAPSRAASPGVGATLTRLRALLKPGLSPASPAALPFTVPAATVTSLAFYEAKEREGLMVYRATEVPAPESAAPSAPQAAAPGTESAGATPGGAPERPAAGSFRTTLRVPVDWLDLFDPRTETERRIALRVPPGSLLELPLRADDLVLRFRVTPEASPLRESLQVETEVQLSAEEIIAKEREVRAAQTLRLQHYEADVPINIHYRISSLDTSVDILTENRLYVHDGKQDYVEKALYVDGALWRGKERPSLPFLAPETVKEIPLDIVLEEGYRYSLAGRDTIGGRPCYVIAIEPTITDRTLYRGKVYIDARRFNRLRMDAVQTNLKDPLRSNHVTYEFAPVSAPAGEFWLPSEVRSQMVFELLGQNLVVEREAHYRNIRVNQEGLAERVATEYASPSPIFRDTPEGYFQVERRDGAETLQSVRRTRNTFLVMGANIGYNGSPGLPFAGVNFFDFDFRGSGTQFDVAWAGPFVDLSWTDPRLSHPKGDRAPIAFAVDGTFNALAGKDRNAREDGTDSNETIDYYDERVRATFAVPMGHFAKWSFEQRFEYFNFQRRSETGNLFVLPSDTVELGSQLRLEINRRGLIAAPWVEAGRRLHWQPWGYPGTPPFDPADRDFTRRGIELFKSFYPSLLRKLSFGLQGFDGSNLDRFSRFELGDFRSARVHGFNGSGIHFDRGLIASTGYAFTIRNDVRVDLGLETGWIQSRDDFGPGYERVTGLGLGFEFSGPWSTLANVRLGQGISSTIPGKGSGGDIRVVLFKTWDKWSRKTKP